MRKVPRSRWAIFALAILIATLLFIALNSGEDRETLRLDQFLSAIDDGDIRTAVLMNKASAVEGETIAGRRYRVEFPAEYADELTERLLAADVGTSSDTQATSLLEVFLTDLLPTLIVVGVFLWFMLQMQGGGRANRFGKARARKRGRDRGDVTFEDVAGADEAVAELQEIKDFLSDPDRFRRLGAKIPKGVLLYGPPGTGKTLLARAVAGEAGVPFLTISGSDFVEMFVGVGAARVRDLFKQAKDEAPAIVFVDEIDAVGRHRGTGVGGGHDEREQTLNQLLVELDGFDERDDVILMAATNRPDILDAALLRPGRFDRHIAVDAPDRTGRQAILEVHSRNKPLESTVSLSVLARRTPGFTGADLANIVNEAALLAGRQHRESITMGDMSEAVDRVMAGPERRSRVMSEHEKSVTAHHEAGHALVGHLLPAADPVHKVSIVARGRALGWTLSLPTEDRYTHTADELRARLAVYMGGLSAEELVFGQQSTGAADDIDGATKLARAMVTEFGMSDRLGPQRLSVTEADPMAGRERRTGPQSTEVASIVDSEVKRLLDEAHETARALIEGNRESLERLAARLIDVETIDEDELGEILRHKP